MPLSATLRVRRRRKAFLAAAWLFASILAMSSAATLFLTGTAHADPGGGKGGGNGGGNAGGGNGGGGGGNAGGNSGGGNAGGNAGGNSGGNSNAGGNSGNSNAGGNSGNSNAGGNSGNSNAGGNSSNSNAGGNSGTATGAAGSTSATEIVDPRSVLSLRETGLIQPLDLVYDTAEEQLGGKVVGAKLMVDETQGLTYDLRVVTEDGRVRRARYDAASLALLSVDDQQIQ